MKENKAYHSDYTVLSSSMLKTILENPQKFEFEYITGQRADSSAPHFIEGSYVHSLILEPEKTELEYAIYDGFVKRGAAYDTFSAANHDKTVISAPQKQKCLKLLEAYNARPEAMSLIKDGHAEHMLTSTILDVPVKCRADYINIKEGYIVDVKTTGELSGPEMFQYTIAKYKYDLSAALYCQIALNNFDKLFDFYWIVISKQDHQCHVYKASTKSLSEGTAQYIAALVTYRKCKESGIWTKKQATKDLSTANYEIQEI